MAGRGVMQSFHCCRQLRPKPKLKRLQSWLIASLPCLSKHGDPLTCQHEDCCQVSLICTSS